MDPRDREAMFGKWYDEFNEQRMSFVLFERDDDGRAIKKAELDEDGGPMLKAIYIPATYGVCGLCDGQGRHVNPSIDYNGLTREDFDDDPEFEEMYFGGGFDVSCYRCKGKRVEPIVNWNAMSEELRSKVQETIDAFEDDVRERESEMRMEYGGYY